MTLTLGRRSPATHPSRQVDRPRQSSPDDLWSIDETAVAGCLSTCALSLETFFQAAHTVRGSDGRGKRVTRVFRVQLACSFTRINPSGPLPSALVREQLDALARRYVGQHLNDLPPFRGKEPTAEQIAAVIFCQLERLLADLPLTIDAVTVYESPTHAATCRHPGGCR